MMKVVFAQHGLPQVDYAVVLRSEWARDRAGVRDALLARLPAPLFVKPANLGSSVGISKVHDAGELDAALDLAAGFDRKIVVEAGVPNAREIECAVLGNDAPEASMAGEVVPSREFYDYEAKYLDEGSKTIIPADLTAAQLADVQRLSKAAFLAIDGTGLARVDFLLCRDDGRLYVNEVNTLPGFTTISMYSKLWEASGRELPRPDRSPDRAGHGAPRRQAAAAHERPLAADEGRARAVGRRGLHRARRGAGGRPEAAPAARPPHRQRPTPAPLLTGADGLSRAYDAIFDADFERARTLLAEACPPAPREACLVLEATRQLWRIQLDPEDRSRDAAFDTAVTAAITAAEAWTTREPRQAEAWFYLGGAYGARVQWRVLRQERLGAARDGREVKNALDRTLALAPGLVDAQFGLGLYEYYADIAPTAAKILRVLMMLPGGDRARGLARMQRTRQSGQLLADEAAFQLHVVYFWYENRAADALALLGELVRRHPRNPYFRRAIADAETVYLHDMSASLASWRELARLADTNGVNEARAGAPRGPPRLRHGARRPRRHRPRARRAHAAARVGAAPALGHHQSHRARPRPRARSPRPARRGRERCCAR